MGWLESSGIDECGLRKKANQPVDVLSRYLRAVLRNTSPMEGKDPELIQFKPGSSHQALKLQRNNQQCIKSEKSFN